MLHTLNQIISILCFILVFPTSVFAEPLNLSLLKKELIHYHDSGLYYQDLNQKIKTIQGYVIEQSQINKKSKHPQKLALVLDIDETSLSNYNQIVLRDFTGSQKQIHLQILKANSKVIKPMLDLYRTALKHGVNVFFVSGRIESERKATEINLKKAGYSHWSGLYLKPVNYPYHSIIPFKSESRAKITHQGYVIIATIGDQFSDLKGGYAQKRFKLPNPFYYIP